MNSIDTSIEGFRYVGINLTEEQYKELCQLNALILMNENRQKMPVFNIMLVLKILNLLPAEIRDNISGDNCTDNSCDKLQKNYGKIKY